MSDQKTIMRDMLANAVHFGHKSSKWNPKMAPYLFTKKNGVHIFDLNQTYKGLTEALDFLRTACGQGKKVLFVSTKQQSTALIREEAEKCHMPYVTSKWIPGLLTNFKTIRTRVKYMQKLQDEQESGGFEKYTKKEALNFGKQIMKLQAALGGVADLEKPPAIVFVVDVVRDKIAVQEAKKVGATVVAIVDSNANPDGIDYIIPANDDAIKSITYLVTQISAAVQGGASKTK
jgi:small subunit ribosomal protein S2